MGSRSWWDSTVRGHETTIGVYVDHNLGGLAKDVFAVPAGIAEVLAESPTEPRRARRPGIQGDLPEGGGRPVAGRPGDDRA